MTAYLKSKLSGTFASFDCFCSLKCCAIATALSWKLDAEHLLNVMTVCVCVSVTKAKGERSKKPFLERKSKRNAINKDLLKTDISRNYEQ